MTIADTDPPANRRVTTEELRDRIARARQDGTESRGELAVLETDASELLKFELRRMEGEFAKAMGGPPSHAELLVRDACTAVSKTEGLWEAEPATVLGAAMTAAQLNLRIGVLGQCWILPFWNGEAKAVHAQIIIGYQGYIELCYRSGRVVDLASEIVYEKEVADGRFDFWRTEDRPHLMHRPDLTIAARHSCPRCNETDPKCPLVDNHGELIHAFYATARTKGGGFNVTRPWGLAMMRQHRAKHVKTGRSGKPNWFWTDNFPAAGRKTMIRDLTRLLPKNADIANALHADYGVRTTFHYRTEAGEATVHPASGGHIDAEAIADSMEAGTLHPADGMS